MELKNISPEEFTAMYNAFYEPKQKVDKVDVRSIVSEFVYSGAFIMEVVLNEQDQLNSRAIAAGIRDYIEANKLALGVHERKGRIFLRNDSVPACLMVGYPRGIVNASNRNRWRIHH